MPTENILYSILLEKIKQGTLVLPTLPRVALQVRRAADDDSINLTQMSDIIAHDPALSLGILKVANGALLGRTVKVETVNQAVTRIGLRRIKSIATAMAIEQVFVSEHPVVSVYLKKAWDKTIDVAAVAITLMNFYLRDNKHSSLSLDTISLASLVHNIGILPILTEAEQQADMFAEPNFLQQAISKLSGNISAAVIEAWGFSSEFIELVQYWGDLKILPKEVHYLDFIRAGAVFNNIFKNVETRHALLNAYVAKGVIPDVHFMQSEEFNDMVGYVRAMFT